VSTGHAHDHGSSADWSRLGVAFGITVTILVVQVVGALLTGSLALLVDSAHVLTDVVGLLVALVATSLVTRPTTAHRTWGLRRVEVLAATAQAAVLLVVGVYVLIEGVRRLVVPAHVAAPQLIMFGAVGLLGNLAAVIVLAPGRSDTLNRRAAFLEVVNDALGSVAVIVAAVVIALTGWTRADAVAALLIGVLILPRTLGLLRETIDVLLESTPRGLDLDAVRAHLLDVPHVLDVHDLHASRIASDLPVLTAHVVIDDTCFRDGHAAHLLDDLQACVAEHFDVVVEHSTFQLEPSSHAAHERARHA
jgi:cobalt-zinc-cadmium efflux system protein